MVHGLNALVKRFALRVLRVLRVLRAVLPCFHDLHYTRFETVVNMNAQENLYKYVTH